MLINNVMIFISVGQFWKEVQVCGDWSWKIPETLSRL